MSKGRIFRGWNEEDLDDLDAKFDALTEHLGLEFVFERVSDGSEWADRSRCYVRVKNTEFTGISDLKVIVTDTPPAPEPAQEYVEECAVEPESASCFLHWYNGAKRTCCHCTKT